MYITDLSEDDIEIAIKVLIVGNGAVGKSSTIQRYCRGTFTKSYKKTIGVDFLEKQLRVKRCVSCCGTPLAKKSLTLSPSLIIGEHRLVSLLSPQQTTVLYWQFANGGKRWRTSAATSRWCSSRTRSTSSLRARLTNSRRSV